MSIKNIALCAMIMGTAFAPVLAMPAYADDIYVTTPPPEPPAETPPTEQRSGYVWAPGYQKWDGEHYTWTPGHWIEARVHYHWTPDSWEKNDESGRWHFKPGHWVED